MCCLTCRSGRVGDTARVDRQHADDLVTALLTASRALVGISARSLATVEETVTVAQFRSLVVLASKGSSTLAHLAGELGVTSSTAQRQVERLVGSGLVSRTENPLDRREVVIELTKAGRRVVDTVTNRRRQAIARIATRMSPVDSAAFINALRAFAVAANEPDAAEQDAAELGW